MSNQFFPTLTLTRASAAATAMPARVAGAWVRSSSWITKGTLAVLDQGLISGSNFLISVLLARWMGAEQYGAYTLAYSILLLFLVAYQALVLEPMSVFGPAQYRRCEPEYLGTLLRMHGVFTTAIVAIMLLSALAVWKLAMPHYLLGGLHGVMIATPCVLLFWLARRAFYMQLLPGGAVVGAVLYCVILGTGLWILYRYEMLSSFTAFLLMGLGALATSVLLLARLKPPLRNTAATPRLGVVTGEHWEYGKWALASAAVAWFPWNFTYILTGTFHGMAATAELKVLLNLALPMRQSFAAFSLLLIPYASRLAQDSGSSGIKGLSRRITWLFAAGGLAYWLFIVAFREQAMQFLYGGNYTSVVYLVPWIAMISILTGALQGQTIALRGMQAPFSIFVIECITTGTCLVVGIPCIWLFGTRGAIAAIFLSSVAGLVASFVIFHGCMQKRSRRVFGS